jgi:putative transcriptional regulator
MGTTKLHNRVREHRKQAGGLTQQELAQRAGVTRQSIISIERGRYRPSVELALRLASVLGCVVEDLFQLGEER